MSKILQVIGGNIRKIRKSLKMSQAKLAETAGFHRTYIGAVERGEKNISANNIAKIADVLGVAPYLLLYHLSKNDNTETCAPVPVNTSLFNPNCKLPYGLTADHIQNAMNDFVDFIGFINRQLDTKEMERLESFLMPANFSSIVGEFMNMTIPKYCPTLVKNQYHNGHPDLIPAGLFANDAIQYAEEGIEVKGSRHARGWQGHNPESVWFMVFYFDSNTSNDRKKKIGPKPFQFKGVYAAKLDKTDWTFSGRSETRRRTITASVNRSGVEKMKSNRIYEDL